MGNCITALFHGNCGNRGGARAARAAGVRGKRPIDGSPPPTAMNDVTGGMVGTAGAT